MMLLLNRKKIGFVMLLSAMLTSAFSQVHSILGIVLDSTTQEAIVGAVIYLKNTNISTFTDTGGRFQLPVALRDTLVQVQVHHIGYEDEIWVFKPNNLQIIRLKSKPNLLEPVIIQIKYWLVPIHLDDPPFISDEEIAAYKRAEQAKQDSIIAARKPKGWRFWKKIVE